MTIIGCCEKCFLFEFRFRDARFRVLSFLWYWLLASRTFQKKWWVTFPDFQVHSPVRVRTTRKCVSESFLQVQLFMWIDVYESRQLYILVRDPDLVVWDTFENRNRFLHSLSRGNWVLFIKTGVPVFKVLQQYPKHPAFTSTTTDEDREAASWNLSSQLARSKLPIKIPTLRDNIAKWRAKEQPVSL